MAIITGEAHLDLTSRKYFYEIQSGAGEVLLRSEVEFESKEQAETELIALLQGLGREAKRTSGDA